MPGLRKHFVKAKLASFALYTFVTQSDRQRKPGSVITNVRKGEDLFSLCVLSALYGDSKFISIHNIKSFLEVR